MEVISNKILIKKSSLIRDSIGYDLVESFVIRNPFRYKIIFIRKERKRM